MRSFLNVIAASLVVLTATAANAGLPYLVKDINPTPMAAKSDPDHFITIGNYVYFTTAVDGSYNKLWRTDGTDAGTIELGRISGLPVSFNGKVWFTYLGSMWSTDGTVAGTSQLTLPATTPAIYAAAVLMPASNALYFFNREPVAFSQMGWLWRTDGTTAGTTQVSSTKLQLAPQWSDDYRTWAAAGSNLYFVSTDSTTSTNWTVWKTDGTTTAIADPLNGQNTFPIALQTFGNVVVFLKTFSNSTTGQFWRTDGTPAGSFALTKTQAITYSGHDTNVIVAGSFLYFTGDDGTGMKLWRSDGTNAGTTALASSLPGASATFTATPLGRLANGTLLFKGPSVPLMYGFVGLWSFDGTNTTFLANASDGTARKNAVSTGSWALYGTGVEAWRSDGTIGGTYKLNGPLQGYDDTHVWPMAALGGNVLFATYETPNTVRKTDGTATSTDAVRSIIVNTEYSFPQMLRRLNGGVLFTAVDNGGNRDLWFSDGTTPGTQKIRANASSISQLVPCGSRAYFDYYTGGQTTLWATDGTAAGTAMLANVDSPWNMVCIDNRLYFQAIVPGNIAALWRTDGTVPGTYKIKNIGPTGFGLPVQYGHGFFFSDGYSLWASNTTPEGTFQVKPGDGSTPMSPNVVVAGNYAYVSTGSTAQELWRSNASAAGTTKVLEDPAFLLHGAFNRRLVFTWSGSGSSHGYCSLGDAGDTYCFEPLPGGGSGIWTTTFKSLNGRLYYNEPYVMSTDAVSPAIYMGLQANELLGVAGGRLFTGGDYDRLNETDGTSAGTTTLMEMPVQRPEVMESGGRLFIGAEELYAYDLPVTVTAMSPASVPVAGGAVTLTGRGFVNPITLTVGGVPATVGATSATSIAFTAPIQLAGTYPVSLINGDGRVIDVTTPLAYTCAAPTATINGTPAPVCPMVPVQLQGLGGAQCHWYPTIGLDNAASCTPKATINTTTTYTLVVNTADGCPSTNYPTVTVQILPPPSAAITLSSNSMLANDTYTASVPNAGAGATYAWSGTAITIIGDATQRTVTFKTSCITGQLNVTVTTGCGSNAGSRSIEVWSKPSVNSANFLVHPGTVVTVTGPRVGCVTQLSLLGNSEMSLPFTISDSDTLRFTFPPNGQLYTQVMLYSPNAETLAPVTITRAMRDNLYSDAEAEILWRNVNNGWSLIWAVGQGGTLATITPYVRNSGSTDLRVAGMNELGSFDGTAILWQSTSTRALSTQTLLNGKPYSEFAWPVIPPPTLKVAATGDFDGNGPAELLMRDTQTGATSIWQYYGAGSVVQTPVHGGGNLEWTIVAVRDFDFDGRDDILWRNSITGQTLIWFMDGATIRLSKSVHGGSNLEWTIAGVGDFNADGYTDIFWRRNDNGLTLLWQLNAGTITASTTVHSGANLNWSVAAIADFDRDSKSDVLWRETTTGATLYWKMNGPQIAQSISLHSGNNLEWQIEGPRF